MKRRDLVLMLLGFALSMVGAELVRVDAAQAQSKAPSGSVSGGSVSSTITSTVGSGSNALACTTQGCRVDLGPGSTDYIAADAADRLTVPGRMIVNGNFFANINSPSGGGFPVDVGNGGAGGLRLAASALPTCQVNWAGTLIHVAGAGSVLSKLCVCAFDGSTYSWVNLYNPGTRTGNTTTCPAS